MLTGCLILATPLVIAIVWRQPFVSSLMKWLRGRIKRKKKARTLLLLPYGALLNDCEMRQMARDDISLEWITRNGVSDLYIAGCRGKSKAFYDVESLSDWLISNGVSIKDPIWEQIDQLYRN